MKKKSSFLLLISFLFSLSPLASAQNSQEVVLADFEKAETGFTGDISTDPKEAHSGSGAGRIEAKLSKINESPWIGVSKSLTFPNAIDKISFWVKTREADRLTIRITDKTGQTHQIRPPVNHDGKWQEIVITSFEKGEGHQNFGGANDGKVHWPANSFGIMVEKGYLAAGGGDGTVWFDDIRLTLNPERIVGNLDLVQTQPGSIFYPNEPAGVAVDTLGDEVSWTVRDFWGIVLAKGSAPVKDKRAVIEPKLGRSGYFEIDLEARKEGTSLATATVSYAVIAPSDIRKMPNTPFGAMTHFAQGWDTDIMPLIAKAGIGVIRDELYWNDVEKKKGEYTFTRFDPYMAKAKEVGLQPIITMDFGNPLYDHRDGPSTPAGYEGYGNYGQAILKHYGQQIRWLEIWNEYNGSWSPPQAKDDRPKYYTEMLKVAYQKIKAVRPDVKVQGGAAVLLPLPWFEGIFKNGGLDAMDSLVIHPYRWSPEGVDREIDDLRALAAKYGKKDMPVWVTETGRHDDTPEGRTIVARYLVKMYTILLKEKCEMICWYLMRDYNEFKSMGLLRDSTSSYGRYAPAPAYPVYANLIQRLYSAVPQGKDQTADALQVYHFTKNGVSVRVAWALTPSELVLETSEPIKVVDIMGGEQTLQPLAGRIHLALDEEPVYIIGNAKPSSGGMVQLSAAQTVDYGGGFDLEYKLAENIKAEITFEGKAPAQLSPGRGIAMLSGFDSNKLGTVRSRYTLNVEGKPVSTGVILFRVEEPLKISQPFGIKDGTALVGFRNAGRGNLKITGVSSSAGTSGEIVTLAPGAGQNLNLPVQGLRNYEKTPVTLSVNFDGRPEFKMETAISNNPILQKNMEARPSIEAWADVPALPMKVRGENPPWKNQWAKMAWNEKGLFVAVLGDAPFLALELASLNSPLSSWKEFSIDLKKSQIRVSTLAASDAPVPDAEVTQTKTDKGTLTQVSIPWVSIFSQGREPIFRLGLKCGQDAQFGGAVGVFGESTFSGSKNPMTLAAYYLQGDNRPLSAAASEGPKIPSGTTRLLTDQLRDFTATQGGNGWTYGYIDGRGNGKGDGRWPSGAYSDDDFKPLSYRETMWGYEWWDKDINFLKLSSLGSHPGSRDGKPAWAVRRWTSNYEGPAKISGVFDRMGREGDGTGFVIMVDGVEVLGANVKGSKEVFEIPVTLKKGSLVDFATTPGPANDTSFDACGFQVTIEAFEKAP